MRYHPKSRIKKEENDKYIKGGMLWNREVGSKSCRSLKNTIRHTYMSNFQRGAFHLHFWLEKGDHSHFSSQMWGHGPVLPLRPPLPFSVRWKRDIAFQSHAKTNHHPSTSGQNFVKTKFCLLKIFPFCRPKVRPCIFGLGWVRFRSATFPKLLGL